MRRTDFAARASFPVVSPGLSDPSLAALVAGFQVVAERRIARPAAPIRLDRTRFLALAVYAARDAVAEDEAILSSHDPADGPHDVAVIETLRAFAAMAGSDRTALVYLFRGEQAQYRIPLLHPLIGALPRLAAVSAMRMRNNEPGEAARLVLGAEAKQVQHCMLVIDRCDRLGTLDAPPGPVLVDILLLTAEPTEPPFFVAPSHPSARW